MDTSIGDDPEFKRIGAVLLSAMRNNEKLTALNEMAQLFDSRVVVPAAPLPALKNGFPYQEGLDIKAVLYTDNINDQQICRDDLWLATTEALNKLAEGPAPMPEAAPLPAQPEQIQTQQSGSIRPSAESAGQHKEESATLFDLWWGAREVYLSIVDYGEPGLVPMNPNSAMLRDLSRVIDATKKMCVDDRCPLLELTGRSVTAEEIGKITMSLIEEFRNNSADVDSEVEGFIDGAVRGIENLHAELLKLMKSKSAASPSPAPAQQQEPSVGLEAAAALIEKKVADYDREHGNTDPDTGTREYPGDGAEWVGQMEELAEEIRAQSSKSV